MMVHYARNQGLGGIIRAGWHEINFITTNIRWLAGGGQTEEIKQRISLYEAEIKEIENNLIFLRQDLKSVRGF